MRLWNGLSDAFPAVKVIYQKWSRVEPTNEYWDQRCTRSSFITINHYNQSLLFAILSRLLLRKRTQNTTSFALPSFSVPSFPFLSFPFQTPQTKSSIHFPSYRLKLHSTFSCVTRKTRTKRWEKGKRKKSHRNPHIAFPGANHVLGFCMRVRMFANQSASHPTTNPTMRRSLKIIPRLVAGEMNIYRERNCNKIDADCPCTVWTRTRIVYNSEFGSVSTV